MKIQTLILTLLPALAAGHASMQKPYPNQPDALYWFQVACYNGCECAGFGKEAYPLPENHKCPNATEPTNNDPKYRTFAPHGNSPAGDWNKYFPWRSPGASIPQDSCGIASGFVEGADSYGSYGGMRISGKHYKQGDRFTKVKGPKVESAKDEAENIWVSGKTANVSYSIVVNHGGGYQYRLCPKSSTDQGESCYEAGALDFATDKHTVNFVGVNKTDGTRRPSIEIDATDLTTGVKPVGKAWRRIPTPACACDSGSGCNDASADLKDSKTAYKTHFGATYSYTKDYNAEWEKVTNETKKFINCGSGTNIEKGPLQFYPKFIVDGTWPDGYGYYMGSRIDHVYYPGKMQSKVDISSKDAAAKKAASTDPCREHDSDVDMCGKTAGCSSISKSGITYCITQKLRSLMGHLASEKTSAGTKPSTSNDYYGADYSNTEKGVNDFEIMDIVKVPTVKEATEYTLSWRWDCEQTPQIWTTCADVTILPTEEARDTKLKEIAAKRADEKKKEEERVAAKKAKNTNSVVVSAVMSMPMSRDQAFKSEADFVSALNKNENLKKTMANAEGVRKAFCGDDIDVCEVTVTEIKLACNRRNLEAQIPNLSEFENSFLVESVTRELAAKSVDLDVTYNVQNLSEAQSENMQKMKSSDMDNVVFSTKSALVADDALMKELDVTVDDVSTYMVARSVSVSTSDCHKTSGAFGLRAGEVVVGMVMAVSAGFFYA